MAGFTSSAGRNICSFGQGRTELARYITELPQRTFSGFVIGWAADGLGMRKRSIVRPARLLSPSGFRDSREVVRTQLPLIASPSTTTAAAALLFPPKRQRGEKARERDDAKTKTEQGRKDNIFSFWCPYVTK